jgi:hypothetical protein
MRVSQYYKLGKSQAELDFVDVDVKNDTPVFLSPRALHFLPSEWGDHCVYLLQDFFQTLLKFIQAGQNSQAEGMLRQLREPNETHLGLSKGKSNGRALGERSAHDVWGALSSSVAAKSGLLKDLEDTILVIDGIDVDIISDMTTNIIREPLIAYTQEMASWHGIPLQNGVASGPMWNPTNHQWKNALVELPIAAGHKLLLVPKAIVRQSQIYRTDEYYRHYLLEHLREEELRTPNSTLVHLLKDGRPRVYKTELMEKYGTGKKAIVRETLRNPQILENYRDAKERSPHVPLEQEAFAEIESAARTDWDGLLNNVIMTPKGKVDADRYEKNVEALLTALFYPDLVYPKPQQKIHAGRKRIDIAYTNMAQGGFFNWISKHYPAAHVFFECKNYGKDVGNPELDQLAGRFSPSRGQIGFLVCRQFHNKAKFLASCKDTASDNRGFIIALDDSDLKELVESRKSDIRFQVWRLLQKQFNSLIA